MQDNTGVIVIQQGIDFLCIPGPVAKFYSDPLVPPLKIPLLSFFIPVSSFISHARGRGGGMFSWVGRTTG
jgi:hypothetical protein